MSSLSDAIKSAEAELSVEIKTKMHAKDGEITSLRAENRRLLSKLAEMSDNLDAIAALRGQEKIASRPVRNVGSGSASNVIPIVAWSDWHVAEVVSSQKTNGKNKYDPDIAKKRARVNTDNTLRLIAGLRESSVVDEIVLILGGDFITGYLHEELAQTNAMGPIEEAHFAQCVLEEEVSRLIENASVKTVRIVCHRGNHGRTTRRIQFKNDYETSYETWIYWNLRDRIAGDGVEWVIPEADIHYTNLMGGCLLRSMHGHQIKYGGGIGGIAVPLNRWLAKQDQTTPAVGTVLGHFHTFEPAGKYSINSSLKGWDEFAQSKGFPFEHPCQMMKVFDCKRRQISARFPIFCE